MTEINSLHDLRLEVLQMKEYLYHGISDSDINLGKLIAYQEILLLIQPPHPPF